MAMKRPESFEMWEQRPRTPGCTMALHVNVARRAGKGQHRHEWRRRRCRHVGLGTQVRSVHPLDGELSALACH